MPISQVTCVKSSRYYYVCTWEWQKSFHSNWTVWRFKVLWGKTNLFAQRDNLACHMLCCLAFWLKLVGPQPERAVFSVHDTFSCSSADETSFSSVALAANNVGPNHHCRSKMWKLQDRHASPTPSNFTSVCTGHHSSSGNDTYKNLSRMRMCCDDLTISQKIRKEKNF